MPSRSRAAAIAFSLVFASLLALPAAAQRAPRRAADPEQRLTHLTQRLELSEAQQQRIRPILEQEASELRELFQKARESEERGPLREQVQAIRKKNDARIEAELSEEQKRSFTRLREEQRERMEQRRQQRPPATAEKEQGEKQP